jgi:hypothetical protein
MKPGGFACISCGSPNIRRARVQSHIETLRMAIGVYPFRCTDCDLRFPLSIWSFSKLKYAKCSRCLGTRLSVWSRHRYRLRAWQKFLIYLGAGRYYCPGCRHPFLSFRPRLVVADSETVADALREKGPGSAKPANG